MSTTAIELKSYPSPISEDNAEIRSNSVELEALFAKRAGKPKPLRAIDRFTDHVARNEEGYAISMLSLPMISVIPMTLTGDLTTILLVAVGLPAAIFGALVGSLVHTHRSKKEIRTTLKKSREQPARSARMLTAGSESATDSALPHRTISFGSESSWLAIEGPMCHSALHLRGRSEPGISC